MKQLVGIIGAGVSGLLSAKFALENDIIPIVFDKHSYAGGLWAPQTAVWDDMCSIFSKYSMTFSDFPWPKHSHLIPTATEVHNYLQSFIKTFNIEQHLNLNSEVTSVTYLDDKKWKIKWICNNTEYEKVVDFIVFGSGVNSKPRIPVHENMNRFKGLVLHSSEYKSTTDERFKDKRVVVVGNGLSAIEISSQLVGHAKSVVNIFRRPSLTIPRLTVTKLQDQSKFNVVPVDLSLFTRKNFCISISSEQIEIMKKKKFENFKKLSPIQLNKDICPEAIYYDFTLKENQPTRIVVDSHYASYVKEGKIVAKKTNIKGFCEASIDLEDGSCEHVDVILFCTGYYQGLGYLDKSTLEKLNFNSEFYRFPLTLYGFTFHPEIENAAFVGQNVGLFFVAIELQARLAFEVFTKRKVIPIELMYSVIEKEKQRRLNDYSLQFPYGNYVEMIDKLASELGRLPDFDDLSSQNKELHEILWNNTIMSSHFFMKENPEKSKEILDEVDNLLNSNFMQISKDNPTDDEINEEIKRNFIETDVFPKIICKYLAKK